MEHELTKVGDGNGYLVRYEYRGVWITPSGLGGEYVLNRYDGETLRIMRETITATCREIDRQLDTTGRTWNAKPVLMYANGGKMESALGAPDRHYPNARIKN